MNMQMKLDKIISVLFHPLFIPVYGMALIMSSNSPFGYLPFHVKRLIYMIMVVNNVILPLSIMPFLMHMKFIRSWSLEEKEERTVPLIIVSVLYATSTYLVFRFPVPGFLKAFLFTAFLISALLTLVNFKWKISIHATGMGAVTALILFLSFRLHATFFWYFVICAAISGMVISARLRMNLHSPREVWYGFTMGFVLTLVFLHFFQQFV